MSLLSTLRSMASQLIGRNLPREGVETQIRSLDANDPLHVHAAMLTADKDSAPVTPVEDITDHGTQTEVASPMAAAAAITAGQARDLLARKEGSWLDYGCRS